MLVVSARIMRRTNSTMVRSVVALSGWFGAVTSADAAIKLGSRRLRRAKTAELLALSNFHAQIICGQVRNGLLEPPGMDEPPSGERSVAHGVSHGGNGPKANQPRQGRNFY